MESQKYKNTMFHVLNLEIEKQLFDFEKSSSI